MITMMMAMVVVMKSHRPVGFPRAHLHTLSQHSTVCTIRFILVTNYCVLKIKEY